MNFYCKNGIIRRNIIFSIFWFIIGLLWFAISNSTLLGVAYLALGLTYFIMFSYCKTKPLLEIKKDSITKYSIFRNKTILIKDIVSIKNPFGDFTIISKHKEINIVKEELDNEAYTLLKIELQKI